MKRQIVWLSIFSAAFAGAAGAAEKVVAINAITADGIGAKIGSIAVTEAGTGTEFKINVSEIPDGEHGFHVHEKGDCGPGLKDGKPAAGMAAGDHYDPQATKSHKGPHAAGHKGDLPKLTAKSVVRESLRPNSLPRPPPTRTKAAIHTLIRRRAEGARAASPAASCRNSGHAIPRPGWRSRLIQIGTDR